MSSLLQHEPGMFFWEATIFIIFILLLKKVAWKPVTQKLFERHSAITEALSKAERTRAEIAALNEEMKLLRKKTIHQRDEILKEAKIACMKIMEESSIEAKKQYERIIANAAPAIEKYKQDAIREIKNKTGKMVIDITKKILERELSRDEEQEDFMMQMAHSINLSKRNNISAK